MGSLKAGLHPVQQRLATLHGSQCGFCTPGFVMAMYALLRATNGRPSEQQIAVSLAGNLWCACLLPALLPAHRICGEAWTNVVPDVFAAPDRASCWVSTLANPASLLMSSMAMVNMNASCRFWRSFRGDCRDSIQAKSAKSNHVTIDFCLGPDEGESSIDR